MNSQFLASNDTEPDAILRKLISEYKRRRRPLAVSFRDLGEASGFRLALRHSLHPYPARLLPQIPHLLLGSSYLTGKRPLILDPFCGSGTVLLEAQLAGLDCIGGDQNPLARLISKVKTSQYDSKILFAALRRILRRSRYLTGVPHPNVVNIKYWYYPHIIRDLSKVRKAICDLPEREGRDVFLICLSKCAAELSLADPRIAVPVRLKPTNFRRTHPLRKRMADRLARLKRISVFEAFEAIARSTIPKLHLSKEVVHKASISVIDAKTLALASGGKVRSGSVSLVLTSPPYPGAQKYIRSSSLSLGWLGLATPTELRKYKQTAIGREEVAALNGERIESGLTAADRRIKDIRRIDAVRASVAYSYLREMKQMLTETFRVLRPGGFCVLIIGDSVFAGKRFRTSTYLHELAQAIGFSLELELLDQIKSRVLLTERHESAGTIFEESIAVLRKSS